MNLTTPLRLTAMSTTNASFFDVKRLLAVECRLHIHCLQPRNCAMKEGQRHKFCCVTMRDRWKGLGNLRQSQLVLLQDEQALVRSCFVIAMEQRTGHSSNFVGVRKFRHF